MELKNYKRTVVETHVFELDEKINGEDTWIRVEKDDQLDHWKPASKEDVHPNKLNGSAPDPRQVQKLEQKFNQSDYEGGV
jgi:hypothetical protein